MTTAKAKTEMAAKAKTEMAAKDQFSDNVPDFYKPTEQARGSEDVTMDDIAIPRIDVIQDLSPQHKKNNAEYIEGAEVGILYNTITSQLYGLDTIFIPVFFRKEYIIWKDRDSGGGFRGAFKTMAEATTEFEALPDASVCEIVETAQHFILVVDTTGKKGPEEAVLSMAKSKMKPSRQLNSMVRLSGGDRFSRAYKLSAVPISGTKGDYFGFNIKQLGFVQDEVLYKKAESMYDSIRSGERNINRDDVTENKEYNDEDDY